ncbi:sensor histidine kinase [Amycolatopsis sp. NPDC004368]
MSRTTLRARLTLIHTGLFLVASLVVVGIIYLVNRDNFMRAQSALFATSRTPDSADPAIPAVETPSKHSLPGEDALSDLLSSQLVLSALTFLTLGVVAGVLGWWLSGRLLHRVHVMTEQARRISTANLHERIALTGPRDELKELADTFDDLLRRLDDAFKVQGRFIANASHELRTPLAVTRTVIQVGLSSPEPDRVRRVREELLKINDRSIALIGGLLQLARGEQELQHRERVRVDELVENVVGDPVAHGVAVELRTQPCAVSGDEVLLGQLFTNLLENALRYNVDGGAVWVGVTGIGESVHLEVANTGAPIERGNVERLFEPFQRGVPRTGGGAGLGLSIVRAVATAHGGRVEALPRAAGGLTVTVVLPACP